MRKKINLLCFTFAGGNKYSYRPFSDNASSSVFNIITLEYPGRGSRIKEPLVSDIHTLVDDLYKQVKSVVDADEYVIYGHSLGGLIAYLMTIKLLENNHRMPEHLFITGTTGPASLARVEKMRSLLPHDEFIEEIKSLGGMPDEILQSEDLLNYLEPILRNDFGVSEKYVYVEREPLKLPLTVITGTEEDMKLEDIRLWQKESVLPVDFRKMPGGHFFILKYIDEIMQLISEKSLNLLKPIEHGQ